MRIIGKAICPGIIISGLPLVYGRRTKREQHFRPGRPGAITVQQWDINQVGFPDAYIGSDETVDASDLSRKSAAFLILSVTERDRQTWVEAVRLSDGFNYNSDSEVVEFIHSHNSPNGVAELERIGLARTASSIQQGDVIQSGEFAGDQILKQKGYGKEKPTSDSRFLVHSVVTKFGEEFHGRREVADEGVYVTAFQLNESNCCNPPSPRSTRVEFFMSGKAAPEQRINSVKLIATTIQYLVLIEPV